MGQLRMGEAGVKDETNETSRARRINAFLTLCEPGGQRVQSGAPGGKARQNEDLLKPG